MWLNDRSPNITRLASKDRSGDVVRDRHSHEREQGHVESDRPESDRHHQQVHVDRPQRGGHRPGEIGRHTSELQSRLHLVCRLLLEKKKNKKKNTTIDKTTNITS